MTFDKIVYLDILLNNVMIRNDGFNIWKVEFLLLKIDPE